MESPPTLALRAAFRAEARLARLLPQLERNRRETARLQAEQAELLAMARNIADDWAAEEDPAATSAAEFPHRSVAAEIAAAWRVSDRTVQRQIDEAACLVTDYPETFTALADGEISPAHVRVIVTAGSLIDRPELRAEFEASVLDYAKSESASRLNPIAKRRAEWFAGSPITERHARAREQRRVWAVDLEDGLAELRCIAPAVVVHGIYDRLTQMGRAEIAARAEKAMPAGDSDAEAPADSDAEAADTRSLDQLRADIMADLLLATDPIAHNNGPTGLAAIHANIQLTVPVLGIIDDSVRDPFESAMLDGHSPVDPETARILTANAPGVDRVLTHPISGAVLAVDRYRSTEELKRYLRVRDEHCRFPGCRMPARRCDLDHTIDHALGGVTAAENLAHLCRRHHTLKHQTTWIVRQRGGGVLEWTSPTGRTYADVPVSTVSFAPDAECDRELAPF